MHRSDDTPHPTPKAPSIVAACFLFVAGATACKPPAPHANLSLVAGNNQPVESVTITADAAATGHITLVSEDPQNKAITRVDALDATFTITTPAPAALTRFEDLGTLSLRSLSLQVNGISNCSKNYTSGAAVVCKTQPTTTTIPMHPPPPPAPIFTAADYRPLVIYHDGMRCGNHDANGGKWQKAFDVGIESSVPGALVVVEKVVHPVFAAYTKGPFTVTRMQDSKTFATSIGFLTPVQTWTLSGSTVYLRNGKSFVIAPGRVSWQDNDASKPAGGPCQTD